MPRREIVRREELRREMQRRLLVRETEAREPVIRAKFIFLGRESRVSPTPRSDPRYSVLCNLNCFRRFSSGSTRKLVYLATITHSLRAFPYFSVQLMQQHMHSQ